MIRIKFEVEEPETEPLPIESKNVGFPSEDNYIVTKKPPEMNVVVEAEVSNKVVPKKKKKPKLDNSTADSVAVGSKSIKTEPVESSLSLTTQLNNSLNIQSLLRQNRIQNGWTTNEQSIPIGTQQQQQSFLLHKIEPIVPDNQEVPLSLDQSSSSIPNGTQQQQQQSLLLPKIEPIFSDNQEISLSLDRGSLVPNGTQQKPQYLLLPKIKPIVSEIQQEVPLSLDQCSSISNSNSMEITTTTATNPVPRRRENVPKLLPPSSADNSESTYNDIEQNSVFGSISGSGPSSFSSPSSVVVVAAPSPRQQWLASATPEQQEQKRLKNVELVRRHREKESEEQRQRRLEQMRQYNRTVRKQRKKQWLANATPQQREQKRFKEVESYRRQMEKETEEQRQQRLERVRQYNRTVAKQRREQKRSNFTPDKPEKSCQKRCELSMDDFDLSHFDIDGGGGGGCEESNGQTITTLESPKPGPSKKLPRPTRCQSNLKSMIYLESSTDSDVDSD